MDLLRQLRHVRRHWWVALVTVMVALGVSAFLTVRAQPRYVASVTFFVTTPNPGVTDAYQGGLFLQQRVKSYADLLSSDRLAQSVVAETPVGLTADEVQRRVSTSTETGTVLLRASVTDTDQTRALRVTETPRQQVRRTRPEGRDDAGGQGAHQDRSGQWPAGQRQPRLAAAGPQPRPRWPDRPDPRRRPGDPARASPTSDCATPPDCNAPPAARCSVRFRSRPTPAAPR